ncbi:calmodulin-lysine N-methyltransferase isoform X2 [Eurytemora carolleeae]|uniref:calmodulin-lysine N-methyltransferase isoform X2 n=1 Tax=Eurytemora carolleeae TaxID=1294199 RepID=UPI000C75C10A|nr:calmodulin-lysine N-methyltransferase isoform X2 [Eurytemora carolleeae]|eukprot:XP_023338680.1 calmodulin-lysine N-methyltransferase-like isoform X2 [Eurytemora affinis]
MKENGRGRWKILAKALLDKQINPTDGVTQSKRRFSSYNIFKSEKLEENESGTWFAIQVEQYTVQIHIMKPKMSLNNLTGFNNTGNICIWPSEECLALYCIKNKDLFRDNSVMEIGGGQTCLAGLVVAKVCNPASVTLTDGNQDSVDNLAKIVAKNSDLEISTLKYRWTDVQVISLSAQYDIILCADCLFFDEGRPALVSELYRLLKPGGLALVMAPLRSQTFHVFRKMAEDRFNVEHLQDFDAEVREQHLDLVDQDFYQTDIHYPNLLILRGVLKLLLFKSTFKFFI